MTIENKESLISKIAAGHKPEFLFFWGHRQNGTEVSKSCFSQWYPASFNVGDFSYQSAEHYMMAEKARVFGDEQSRLKIIEATSPNEAKALGRKVRGFSEELWVTHRIDIVLAGNLAKFTQNEELKQFLLSTKGKVLVEASPVDPIWGIGLAAHDPSAATPSQWKGLNLLGFVLMKTRDILLTN